MSHPLDRPVWSSLTTRQAALAEGGGGALRFKADYGIFMASVDASEPSLAALGRLLPADGQVALVETEAFPPVPGADAVSAVLWQMTAEAIIPGPAPGFEIEPLTEADAPQMLALATLTKPGPFRARTHQLGDFVGVKEAGRLVAMAGERMKPTGFTEVSGVCTTPERRGRGYAAALMRHVVGTILARGEIPFLHAYATNTGAIGLYRSLGFALRREVIYTTMTRA